MVSPQGSLIALGASRARVIARSASVFRSVWWSVAVHVHVGVPRAGLWTSPQHGRAMKLRENYYLVAGIVWGFSHSCLLSHCVLFRLATAPPGTTPASYIGRKGQEPLASQVQASPQQRELSRGPTQHISPRLSGQACGVAQWRLGIHMSNSFSTLIGIENEKGGGEWNLKYLAFMRSNCNAIEIIF